MKTKTEDVIFYNFYDLKFLQSIVLQNEEDVVEDSKEELKGREGAVSSKTYFRYFKEGLGFFITVVLMVFIIFGQVRKLSIILLLNP